MRMHIHMYIHVSKCVYMFIHICILMFVYVAIYGACLGSGLLEALGTHGLFGKGFHRAHPRAHKAASYS